MLQIFSKKRYLVDELKGFVDIHNHLLPGIDDGAKSVDDAIAMIREFEAMGVTHFIATPHIMSNYYPNTPETISEARERLQKGLDAEGMSSITLDAAAEHMIDENLSDLLDENRVMPLQKYYLLVEMSYLQPPIHFDEVIVKVANKRYYPVLAHPERYTFLHNRYGKYKKYKQQGIFMQMNLLSLGDYYSKEVPKVAMKLLEDRLIDFVGTDVHNLQQLKALKELKITSKQQNLIRPIVDNTIQSFY